MTTFVLVSGAWLGGWAWNSVAASLRGAGHTVHTPTLTGLGERSHLGGPHVDLDTHVRDVSGVLTHEELQDVVLVGHSYAGAVLPGVADRCRSRLRHLVYIDTAPLPSGTALADLLPDDTRETLAKSVAEYGDGWALPVPEWDHLAQAFSVEGLDVTARDRMTRLQTPHPWPTYTQPLTLDHGNDPGLRQTLVFCSLPPEQRQFFRGAHSPLAGAWTFRELRTGHWPMFSEPDGLAGLLAAAAAADD